MGQDGRASFKKTLVECDDSKGSLAGKSIKTPREISDNEASKNCTTQRFHHRMFNMTSGSASP